MSSFSAQPVRREVVLFFEVRMLREGLAVRLALRAGLRPARPLAPTFVSLMAPLLAADFRVAPERGALFERLAPDEVLELFDRVAAFFRETRDFGITSSSLISTSN